MSEVAGGDGDGGGNFFVEAKISTAKRERESPSEDISQLPRFLCVSSVVSFMQPAPNFP